MRSTVGATLAFVIGLWLTGSRAPLLAPLTALLVIQVSLYATLTSGLRRVASVVAGVLIAAAFSALVGLSWWSLGLLILASLVVGQTIRVNEFVPEVAISAMLVLGVSHVAVAQTAWGRVAETLIGAITGVLLNLLLPPVRVQPAGEAIRELARRMRALLARMSRELSGGASIDQATSWLQEARRLDQEIVQVDSALREAEESMRLNPRVRQAALARLVLRSGLDTQEICAVVLRTLCRSLTDLSQRRHREPVYAGPVAEALQELLTHVGAAVDNFGRLITAQVSPNAERAESELAQALDEGRSDREEIAALLRSETTREPEAWELHGALLANVDRLLSELDVERRSQWLAEEFAEHATRQPPRRTASEGRRRARAAAAALWPRRGR
ncbi:aromatic acid exporter family protein [Streptomyces sp. MTZ3.1]|uniref:Aromatic acid exporter family protein n=1 Tax=Streptomyces meridianus TaxID=2938945 RepID=A0ABT0XBQ1_9ACTN|nr:aromatic acid exporter family protein [Streptomyces meridianus]MCM2579953.1 aromatic acid exporter family protein [Streptomyces meridianus]